MNQEKASSSAAPASKPPQALKRRGRPRSPVFAYFRRMVDEKGVFQGNKCQFCEFVSKDRSENPTYLTRHILRTCSAPQHVKDAMGVRHPSIAIASSGHRGRYSAQRSGPFPSVPNLVVSNSNGRPTTSQALNPTNEQLRHAQSEIQYRQEDQEVSPPTLTPTAVPGSTATLVVVHQSQPAHQLRHPRQTDAQITARTGPSQAAPYVVSAGTPRTVVRAVGVTKTRRGRPRSPALLHFRRHVDEEGNFIANQCSHCTFVSRDRSENSTLLLRHLLSPTCGTPEDVRVVLRGNRYTADGKRTNRGGRARTAASRKTATRNAVGGLVGANELTTRGGARQTSGVQGCSTNRGQLHAALIRFFVRHDIDLRAVESRLFTEMVEALVSTTPMNEVGADKKPGTDGSQGVSGMLIPSWSALQTFWKHTSVSPLLSQDTSNVERPSSAAHLIIYFPDCTASQFPRNAAYSNYSAAETPSSIKASTVASTFHWTSGTHLKYVGSRNCKGDLQSFLANLVSESQPSCTPGKTTFDQVFIGRPVGSLDKCCDIPRNDPVNTWISDVPREIDILGQELLSQVPLLMRCVRRNRLLASFFRESYSNRAAVILFGRNVAEKEQCARYLSHIANPVRRPRCWHALESAEQTYEILQHAQSSHKDRQRLHETGSFLHTISEENAGNVQLCQEITRLVLSLPYRNELKVFISVMRPLVNLITLYSLENQLQVHNDPSTKKGCQTESNLFSVPFPFQARSIAYLLPDCLRTLRDIYAEKTPEFESDLRILRGHTTCRLLGKGTEGFPPIVGEICYLAALLNPGANVSTMKGITVDEAWRRALSFLHSRYSSSADLELERALEQLKSFHRRSGVFSGAQAFNDATNIENPKVWWEKHGTLAPDLCVVALKVLNAPTTAPPVVRHIAEVNARELDLDGMDNDELTEKKRVLHWNLRLSECEYENVSGEVVATASALCTNAGE